MCSDIQLPEIDAKRLVWNALASIQDEQGNKEKYGGKESNGIRINSEPSPKSRMSAEPRVTPSKYGRGRTLSRRSIVMSELALGMRNSHVHHHLRGGSSAPQLKNMQTLKDSDVDVPRKDAEIRRFRSLPGHTKAALGKKNWT